MRESPITIQDILTAGQSILARGRPVTGYSLRVTIGSGRSDRLFKLWSENRHAVSSDSGPAPIPARAQEVISSYLKKSQDSVNAVLLELASVLGEAARTEALAEIESLRSVVMEQKAALDDADLLVRQLEQVNGELEERLEQSYVHCEQLRISLSRSEEQSRKDSSAVDELTEQLALARDASSALSNQLEACRDDLVRSDGEVLKLQERVSGLAVIVSQKDAEISDARRDAQASREREATVNGQMLQLQRDRDVDLEIITRLRLEVRASSTRVSQSEAEAEVYKGQLADLNARLGPLLNPNNLGAGNE